MQRKYFFLIGALVFLFVWCYVSKNGCVPKGSRENFKVLGALGNQKETYYQCLSECERSDPGKRLTPSDGSQSCMSYCDSIITDLTRRGGPSYPDELPVAEAVGKIVANDNASRSQSASIYDPNIKMVNSKLFNRRDQSFAVCGDGTKGAKCRKLYASDGEIDEKCRQDCQYNDEDTKECMDLCARSLSTNKYFGWSWK